MEKTNKKINLDEVLKSMLEAVQVEATITNVIALKVVYNKHKEVFAKEAKAKKQVEYKVFYKNGTPAKSIDLKALKNMLGFKSNDILNNNGEVITMTEAIKALNGGAEIYLGTNKNRKIKKVEVKK